MDLSDAYIVCMGTSSVSGQIGIALKLVVSVLGVPTKFSHFDEYWGPEDVIDARERIQRVGRITRYLGCNIN